MVASELLNYKNWVVVGDVINQSKYAYRILDKLKSKGFKVVGVHPKKEGEGVYKSLKDVPFQIEVIDLCINPALGLEILKEAKSLIINKVLIQPGAESEEILNYCRENNIIAIEDCALVQLSGMK
ncbi:CoA-binding protein [Haloimpatiens lingqiaonensis]|uniref:CoA-binding protein n=1 Tax=Haloimpatiens lingqiaonensis TaxID=1380675 RepID=UPI0010FE7B49|nr:CoA-binding protein [Haloimpatiens lingqiaonensis]